MKGLERIQVGHESMVMLMMMVVLMLVVIIMISLVL